MSYARPHSPEVVREWANQNGIEVGLRGRIKRSIWVAYARAHGLELNVVLPGEAPATAVNYPPSHLPPGGMHYLPPGGMQSGPPRLETMAESLEYLIAELTNRRVLKTEHFALVSIARHLARDLDADRSNAQLVKQFVATEAQLRELLSQADDDDTHEPAMSIADTIGMEPV